LSTSSTRLQLDLNGGSTSSDQSLIYDTIAVDAGDNTRSIYVKSNDGNNYDIYFGGTLASYEIKEVTSEWTRIDATRNFASSGTGYFSIGLRGSTGCSDTADILIYGAQLEAGSYPTSYIPTYGTAATRGVDTITSPTVFNGGSAFSLYFEMGPIDGNDQILLLQTSPLDFYFRWTTSTTLNIWNQDDGSVLKQVTGLNRNQNNKILMVYDGSGGNLIFVNGTKYTAADYTWPSLDYIISVGTQLGIFGFPAANAKTFKSILVFPEALSDAECIILTTL
jgi:hypothetical protein